MCLVRPPTAGNRDGGKNRDEPKQALLITELLQVKPGQLCAKKVCPWQKKAYAQTEGAQAGQLRSSRTGGLILLHSGGGGFRFRGYGYFVGHNNFPVGCYRELRDSSP